MNRGGVTQACGGGLAAKIGERGRDPGERGRERERKRDPGEMGSERERERDREKQRDPREMERDPGQCGRTCHDWLQDEPIPLQMGIHYRGCSGRGVQCIGAVLYNENNV